MLTGPLGDSVTTGAALTAEAGGWLGLLVAVAPAAALLCFRPGSTTKYPSTASTATMTTKSIFCRAGLSSIVTAVTYPAWEAATRTASVLPLHQRCRPRTCRSRRWLRHRGAEPAAACAD